VGGPGSLKRVEGIEHIEDDDILGVSDKMLFYSKELKSSVENEQKAHNPFVIGKLDTESLKNFDFEAFQGYIRGAGEGDKDEEEEAARKMRINRRNFGRFFPKLNERSSLVTIPSMLVLSCNIIETLRLRSELLMALEQSGVLEGLYKRQTELMRKDSTIYLQEPFKFTKHHPDVDETLINFIDEGPASDIKVGLAINEFDESLRSSINLSDPECFKALILPLGLEELRAVLAYEVMNL